MDFGLSLTIEQKQTISQSQIQSLEILSMDNMELNRMMDNEYQENPFLEQELKNMSGAGRKTDAYQHEKKEVSFHDEAREIEDVVLSQLNMKLFTKKEAALIKVMIASLDDNGFFPYDERSFAKDHHVEAAMCGKCLCALRELEPYGIFARDLKSCLIKQLEMSGESDGIIISLLEEHLDALASGKIAQITRKTGWSTLEIRKCLQKIRTLNPRPLSGYGNLDTTAYVIPDIVLDYDEAAKELSVAINDAWMPDYGISDYYYKMMLSAKGDDELYAYFEKKFQRARFLLHSIEQRRETILKVAAYIAQRQQEFLIRRGPKKAETMSDAADHLDIAVSTVSRAVKGKYMQYPSGCIFLKDLFLASVSKTEQEEEKTAEDIKEKIKMLVAEENKEKPLSDMAIVTRLKSDGITVSRRTIAKYRESIGIRGSFERKLESVPL